MKKRLFNLFGIGAALLFSSQVSAQCLNVNGDFESFTGPIITSPNTASNAWINDDLDNWYVSHGSPTTGSSPTTNMWMWSYYGTGEGVYTEYSFVAGQTYELCYSVWRDGTSNPTSEVRVELSNGLTPQYSTGTTVPTPAGNQSLTTQPWTGTGSWVTITETFTASNNYNQLWFYPYLAGAPTPWQAACRIDSVCVKPVVVDPCAFEPVFEVSYEEECVVNFTNTSFIPTGLTVLETYWDFGDGNTATGANVSHYYGTGGVYNVCMTVWVINEDGECCQLTYCREIDAPDCPPCEWIERAEITVTGTNPFTFSVSGLPTGMYDILGYYWDFGDGNTATGQTVNHTYAAGGGYLVCVTIYYYDPETRECCSITICIDVEAGDVVIVDDGDRRSPDLESGTNYENDPQPGLTTGNLLVVTPNPTDGAFLIHLENDDLIQTVVVFSSAGQEVYRAENNEQSGRMSIDLKHLDKGSYIIVVNENDSEKRQIEKVIIH
jgi:hypothetical protein